LLARTFRQNPSYLEFFERSEVCESVPDMKSTERFKCTGQ
jgi:hypothetical protein